MAPPNFVFSVVRSTVPKCLHYRAVLLVCFGAFVAARGAGVLALRSGPRLSTLSRLSDIRLTGHPPCVSHSPQPPFGWTERGRVVDPSRTPQAPQLARSAAAVPERSVEHPRAFEDCTISATVVAVVFPVVASRADTPLFPLKERPPFRVLLWVGLTTMTQPDNAHNRLCCEPDRTASVPMGPTLSVPLCLLLSPGPTTPCAR